MVNSKTTRRRAVRALSTGLSAVVLMGMVSACGGSSDDDKTTTTAATGDQAAATVDQALHDQLPEKVKERNRIEFGALWETPPIIGVEPGDTSKPVGIAPDLAQAIGRVLGVETGWKNMQWPAQLPGLQSGNVDALFGQVSGGKEREQVVDLTAFYRSPLGLLLAAGKGEQVKSFADACGMKIGVPAGSQQVDVVAQNSKKLCVAEGKPAIKSVGYPGAQGAIVAIKGGNVDAWMDSTTSVRDIAKKSNGTFDSMVLPDDQIDPYMERNVTIAVSKSNSGLSRAFAGAMQKLSQSGEYQKIMEKWESGDAIVPEDMLVVNFYSGLAAGEKGSAKQADAADAS